MKTWRERIADARRRGRWTYEDGRVFYNRETCLAAEVAARFGVNVEGANDLLPCRERSGPAFDHRCYDPRWPWHTLWRLGDGARVSEDTPEAFAETEQILDALEDEALRIKRTLTEA